MYDDVIHYDNISCYDDIYMYEMSCCIMTWICLAMKCMTYYDMYDNEEFTDA